MTGSAEGFWILEEYIETRLKDKSFKSCKLFTESDEDFIIGVRNMIAQGSIAKKVAQSIKKEMEKTLDPLELFSILRKHIRTLAVYESQHCRNNIKREVILSGYLTKD